MPDLSLPSRLDFNADAALLRALADMLLEKRAAILSLWRECVEADPQIENSPRLSRSQFYDHIPQVLEAFGARLRADEISAEQRQYEEEMAHQHSRHRWQQGYSLRSLLHEWGYLNIAVLQTLEEVALASQTAASTLGHARLEWAKMVNTNLSEGAASYNQLLQSEAATRLRDLEAAFAGAQEFERARGELLRQTSHDLRGGLSMVVNASELLQGEKISPDERQNVTEILRGGVRSLSEMLRDLLAMSRLEAGQETLQIGPLDAAALLGELGTRSQTLADQKGLWLRCEGPEQLGVQGDASKIGRVAQNLLLNALKYTAQGGVTLRWGRHDERQWFFEIEDSGPGLRGDTSPLGRNMAQATRESQEIEGKRKSDAPPQNDASPQSENAPADNEAASTGDENATQSEGAPIGDENDERPGEGIGLSIVRRLCELLDATLELESEPNQGTKFRVVLPTSYAGAQ